MSLVLWWKFGAVKKTLLAGKGAVYDARSIGNKTPLVILHILTVKDTVYDVAEAANGQEAWKLVEANPDAVNAALTCPECGFQHVIRAEFANGMEKLTSCAFGRFDDQYQGQWRSSWFKLVASSVREMGIKDNLICQSCKAQGVPAVSLY